MPWKETSAMDQRFQLIADWLSGDYTKSELCRMYEISRPTADKWIARYRPHSTIRQIISDRHGYCSLPSDSEDMAPDEKFAFCPKQIDKSLASSWLGRRRRSKQPLRRAAGFSTPPFSIS